MTIEKMTPDEVIESLEYFREIIPTLILLIKMGQHTGQAEAIEPDVEGTNANDDIFIESKI